MEKVKRQRTSTRQAYLQYFIRLHPSSTISSTYMENDMARSDYTDARVFMEALTAGEFGDSVGNDRTQKHPKLVILERETKWFGAPIFSEASVY